MTATKKIWALWALWLALPPAATGRPNPRTQFRAIDTYVLGPKQFAPGSRIALRILSKGVIDLKTNRPIPLARVSLSLTSLAADQERLLFSGHSDLTGVTTAHFRLPNWPEGSYDLWIRCATPFGSDTIRQRIQLQRLGKFLLLTDRPLYQAGEAVFIRSLLLNRQHLKPLANTQILLSIKDSAGQELFQKQEETNAFGGSNAVFQLSDDARPGRYLIQVSALGSSKVKAASRWITVGRKQISPAPASEPNRPQATEPRVPLAGPPFHLRSNRAKFPNGGPLFGSLQTTASSDPVFLDLMMNGQTVLCQSLDVSSGRADFKIRLPTDVFGSLELHAYRMDQSGQLGSAAHTLYVQAPQQLRITVARDRAVYQVGDKARFTWRVTDQAGRPQVVSLGIEIANSAAFSGGPFGPGQQRTHFTAASTTQLHLWSHPAARRLQAVAQLPKILTKAIRTWGAREPLGGRTPAGDWVYRQNLIPRLLKAGLLAPESALDPLGGPFTMKAAQALWPALQAQNLLAGLELDRLRALRAALHQALVKQDILAGPQKAFEKEMERILRQITKKERAIGFSLSGQRYSFEQLKKLPGFSREDFRAQILGPDLPRIDQALAAALGYLPAPPSPPPPTLDLTAATIHSPAVESLSLAPDPTGRPTTLPQTMHFLPAVMTDEKGEARLSLSMTQAHENWQMYVSANSREGGLGSIRHRIRVRSVENPAPF